MTCATTTVMMYEDIIEPVCNPCPKTCQRNQGPFVGTLGWIAYIGEIAAVIVLSLVLVDVIGGNNIIVLGFLLGLTALNVILWIVNTWWRAPCYSMRHTALCDNKCGMYLIMKSCPGDYATRARDDLYQSNDETHIRNSIVTGIYFLIIYALFVGLKGGSSIFDNLNDDSDTREVMNFTISRIIIMAIIGAYGMGIRLLFETRSDFLYRHFTAIVVAGDMGRNGPSYASPAYNGVSVDLASSPLLRNRGLNAPKSDDHFDVGNM